MPEKTSGMVTAPGTAWIATVSPEEAEGLVREVYEEDIAKNGTVSVVTKMMSKKPKVLKTWWRFKHALTFGGSSLGRVREEYIATLVAMKYKCSFCSVVHGELLRKALNTTRERIIEIVRDYKNAGLDEKDVRLIDFALQVATAAHEITPESLDGMRSAGFPDEEIVEICTVTSYRAFMSLMVNSLGLQLDEKFLALEEKFKEVLATGRKI